MLDLIGSSIQHLDVRRATSNRRFYVYILASHSRCIYTGVTNNLSHRMNQHAMELGSRFAARYKTKKLAFYEVPYDARLAIEREKEIKGWRREKKVALIESVNPAWDELPAPRCQ